MDYEIFTTEVYCEKCKHHLPLEVPKVDMITLEPNQHKDELVGDIFILKNKIKSGNGRFEQTSKINIKCPFCENDITFEVKYGF